MLWMSKQMDNLTKEVNMSTPTPLPMYELVSPDLLRTLMQRTGDGHKVSIRDLGEAAGCSHGTITWLLDGRYSRVTVTVAHGIAQRLGVGVLVLFAPPRGPVVQQPLVMSA